jgi:hypothetical protein
MARVAGTSVRSLQAAFAEHLGLTPMEYLRRVRFARAHRDHLLAVVPEDGQSVANIAYDGASGTSPDSPPPTANATARHHFKPCARQRTHDLDARLAALAHPGPLSTAVAAVREVTGDTVGISAAAPGATLGLLRRDPVEPTLLERTSDLAAAAAYARSCHRALAEAARTLDDTTTAELGSTCHDETRALLDQLDDAVPALVTAALATTGGRSSYRAAVATANAQVRGAAGNLYADADHAQHELRDAVTDLLRRARRVPGVTQAETTVGELTAVATAPEDLPIADYENLNVTQIIERLPALTQAQPATVHGFETAHAKPQPSPHQDPVAARERTLTRLRHDDRQGDPQPPLRRRSRRRPGGPRLRTPPPEPRRSAGRRPPHQLTTARSRPGRHDELRRHSHVEQRAGPQSRRVSFESTATPDQELPRALRAPTAAERSTRQPERVLPAPCLANQRSQRLSLAWRSAGVCRSTWGKVTT